MIFLSVCWGIVNIGDMRMLGRIGKTVLLRFLAYLKDTGVICREIRSMTAGYTLSTVQINPVHMAPAWYIVTDIQSYYMDAVTGVVTVAG